MPVTEAISSEVENTEMQVENEETPKKSTVQEALENGQTVIAEQDSNNQQA